jgi:3-hydroxybutyryl-CoA dehydrogenase
MQSVLIVGAGFMGSGIAQVCAQNGYSVHLMDVKPEALEKAKRQIRWSLEKLSAKGTLQESPGTVLERIATEANLTSAAMANWVIECALEIAELKYDVFRELDRLAPIETPLATNTSSIPITRIAKATRNPERVLGIHFFGPVPLMDLVEVVKGEKTSLEVFEQGVDFVRSLGKTPVRVHRDIPGFVMNRVFSAAFREAVDLVDQGVVSVEDVDIGMRLGYGWSSGPFEVADNAGLDTFLLVSQFMKSMDEKHLFSNSKLIEEMVEQGRLGRKAGKGFYGYTAEGKRIPFK